MQTDRRNRSLFGKVKMRLRQEAFLTTPLAMFISPVYIIRRGLYRGILKMAPKIYGNVLDFGCGSKPYESLFTNAKSYTGVDIEVSGHCHKESKVDCFFDGKTLPFPDDYFDSVVSFEVFEHIFNLDEMVSEIRRVLKPNGKLFISIPFAWEEHEIPYDFARYTSYGIKHILETNKFESVEIIKTTTYIMATCQLFINYLSNYVLPEGKILGRCSQLFVIFPLNLMSLFLNFIFPKRYDYFCNSVVLCRKQR